MISIILDLIDYNFINKESLFLSLFTLLSIIFIKIDNRYLIKVFLLGIFYDLIFTNYYLLHGFIFILIGFLVIFFYKYNKYTVINNLFLGIVIMILYQLLLFIIFNLTRINMLNFDQFLYIIKHFIIINIIYIILLSIIKNKKLNSFI